MQLVTEPGETPKAIGDRLTDTLLLSSGITYKSDDDRLKAIKKMVKPGNYVTFHGRGGYAITLTNEKNGQIELVVRDTASQLYFQYNPDGSFRNSKRINLHAEIDGCTRLERVGLEEGQAKGFGDEILHKISNYQKDRIVTKAKLVFPPAVCVPNAKKP